MANVQKGKKGFVTVSVVERFWAKVQKSHGCWLWTGSAHERGYGEIYLNGRNQKAHRVAYEIEHGEIVGKWHVCHRCDEPRCVRPSHLFLGSQSDNIKDAVAKGRHRMGSSPGDANGARKHPERLNRAGRYANKPRATHCLKGHAYEAIPEKGRSICNTCKSASQRERRERKTNV